MISSPIPVVKAGAVLLTKLVEWLEEKMDNGQGADIAKEVLVDEVMHELFIAESQRGGGDTDDRGAIREDLHRPDEEEDALRMAERLVYGWPNRNEEPTGACSRGRFVRAFPLEFPMGIADLYDERPVPVCPAEWVQHMLRYFTASLLAVGGSIVWFGRW